MPYPAQIGLQEDVPWQAVERHERLGSGGFGDVFRATWHRAGGGPQSLQVALKLASNAQESAVRLHLPILCSRNLQSVPRRAWPALATLPASPASRARRFEPALLEPSHRQML